MAYALSKAFDVAQQARAGELLAWGARENWSLNALQTHMQREGLGYRRETMFGDFARAQVTSAAKTPEAMTRADSFFDRVYEPFRKEHKLTRSQMGSIMSAFKRKTEPPEELADLVDQWDEWTEETGT